MLLRQFAVMIGIISMATAASAAATVITTCRGSAGHAYVFDSPSGQLGWQKDSLEDREIQLVQDGKQLDIILNDARGRRSMKTLGFQIFSVPQPGKGFMMVMAINNRGVVEHFLFQLNALGGGSVAWGSLKGSGWPEKKSALYEATCQAP